MWVTVALVNHILSAGEGAWSAVRYNKAHANVSMRLTPAGDHYALMGVFTVSVDI